MPFLRVECPNCGHPELSAIAPRIWCSMCKMEYKLVPTSKEEK